MILRDTTPADHPAVRRLLAAAFGQPAEAELVEALRASGDAAVGLVADLDGVIIGHILLSVLQAPQKCLALAPVAVAPERQNQGTGSALVRAALDRAKAAGWQAVFVLGEPEYYARFGFSVGLAANFETVYPKTYFMALELQRGALQSRKGPVIYAAPFLRLP